MLETIAQKHTNPISGSMSENYLIKFSGFDQYHFDDKKVISRAISKII